MRMKAACSHITTRQRCHQHSRDTLNRRMCHLALVLVPLISQARNNVEGNLDLEGTVVISHHNKM